MKCFFRIVAGAVLALIVHLPRNTNAQSTVFTYQGRVTDNGTNFNGGGQFKFALVTGSNADFTTFWSNDGTSVNGSEPTAAVPVNVSGGLFTVVLGDATQSNMTSINASLFNQPNLRLRIWFNDGVNGSLALDPPQNLTPAPYAIFANTASNLTAGFSVVANNANGAPNVIGGASGNYVSNGVVGATISGGGATNFNGISFSNVVYDNFGTIGGGLGNSAGDVGTVGGGIHNSAGGVATVAGGTFNSASGEASTVSGGYSNEATNYYATVPGGANNLAGGAYSFAAGNTAEALHDGSFVWSDGSLPSGFTSTTSNQFSVRATGGVRFIDGGGGVQIGSSGQYFATGGKEKLRVIRGVVDASGNLLHGTDFTVTHTGTGAYTISFSVSFSDFPSVTVSAQSGLTRIATTTNVGNSSAQIRIFDDTGAAVDAQFAFIAVGPQ